MFNLYAVIPLIILLISSYFFNKKKLDESTPYILMVSTFEGVISYFIAYLIFFEGFFTRFYQYLFMFLLIFIISYIFFLIEKDLDNDMDLQIETIKNNLILFFITIAPLYLFLTIFRFQPLNLQIIYSVLATSGITLIYIIFREPFNKLTESIYMYFAEATANIFLVLWAVVVLLILTIVLIDVPINTLRQKWNLSDNVPYLMFDGFPTTLDNDFKQTKDFQIEIPNELNNSLIDYYVDGDYLYLYDESHSFYTIDINDQSILHTMNVQMGIEDSSPINFDQITNLFFTDDDQLYILSATGLYHISPSNYELVSPINARNATLFVHNNKTYILQSNGLGTYEILKLENDELVVHEEINLDDYTDATRMSVISETLFLVTEETYIDYYNDDYSFEYINSSPIYDRRNHILYSTSYDVIENTTLYYQSTSPSDSKQFELLRKTNTYGIAVNGNIYYVEHPEESFGRVEIMNDQFAFQGIINHRSNTKFWITKQYQESQIINYLEIDGQLTYLQMERNSNYTLLTLNIIEEHETGIPATFYSYYGLFNFIPIFIFLFIPMSNYRLEITFIGFDQILKKSKKDE